MDMNFHASPPPQAVSPIELILYFYPFLVIVGIVVIMIMLFRNRQYSKKIDKKLDTLLKILSERNKQQ